MGVLSVIDYSKGGMGFNIASPLASAPESYIGIERHFVPFDIKSSLSPLHSRFCLQHRITLVLTAMSTTEVGSI